MLVVISVIFAFSAFSAESNTLKAKISDIEGRPMVGAKLFVYDSSQVRRPADFISSLSDRDGLVQTVLPPGKYWVVARFKSDGKYGPLLPGDKHSGEPFEVDMTAGNAEAEFVVADIRELGQKKRANATEALRLKGRVTDTQGVPVAEAFVFANRAKELSEFPDFISAWTGVDGRYELFLSSDAKSYYLGASRRFPLRSQDEAIKLEAIERGKIDIAIDIDFTVE
jgi:hypothetical protein